MSKSTFAEFFGEEPASSEISFDDILEASGSDFPNVELLLNTGATKHNPDFEVRLPGVHPSFFADHKCLAACYYSCTEDKPAAISAKLQNIFDVGKGIHERLQFYARSKLYGTWKCRNCGMIHAENSAFVAYMEQNQLAIPKAYAAFRNFTHQKFTMADEPQPVPAFCMCGCKDFKYYEWRAINQQLRIRGRVDGLFKSANNAWILWEIKSENAMSFARPPRTKYFKQMGLYMMAMNIDMAILTRESKNDQSRIHHRVWLKDIDMQEEMDNIIKVNAMIDSSATVRGVHNPECARCKFMDAPCDPIMLDARNRLDKNTDFSTVGI